MNLIVVGTNADGLSTKKESLFFLVDKLKPSIICIQKTKFSFYRSLTIPGYEIFENLLMESMGGGLLTTVHADLNSVPVTKSDDVELLVVQIEFKSYKVRVLNAYGPQEDDDFMKTNNFWQSLELRKNKTV